MDRESAKLKLRTCKFCSQLDYEELKCELKEEEIVKEKKCKDQLKTNWRKLILGMNRLRRSNVEHRDL